MRGWVRSWGWFFTDCLWMGHEWRFNRNLYGDEINQHSTWRTVARSEWICFGCNAVRYRPELHHQDRRKVRR